MLRDKVRGGRLQRSRRDLPAALFRQGRACPVGLALENFVSGHMEQHGLTVDSSDPSCGIGLRVSQTEPLKTGELLKPRPVWAKAGSRERPTDGEGLKPLKLLEQKSRGSTPICQIITIHQYLRGKSPDTSPWFGRGWKCARANRLLRFSFRGRLDVSRSASETPEKSRITQWKPAPGGRHGATHQARIACHISGEDRGETAHEVP